jgi:hypothetical protein
MGMLLTAVKYTIVGAMFLFLVGLIVWGVNSLLNAYPIVIVVAVFLMFSFLFGWLFLGGDTNNA